MFQFNNQILLLIISFNVYSMSKHLNFKTDPFPISQQCLSCLCEAASACDTGSGCTGRVCGPFRMTQPFWADGGRLTVNNESPDSPTAFTNCGSDTNCSALTVRGHMRTFQQDCNGDGKIDCDDFAAIHRLGGYACKSTKRIPGQFGKRYYKCRDAVGATL